MKQMLEAILAQNKAAQTAHAAAVTPSPATGDPPATAGGSSSSGRPPPQPPGGRGSASRPVQDRERKPQPGSDEEMPTPVPAHTRSKGSESDDMPTPVLVTSIPVHDPDLEAEKARLALLQPQSVPAHRPFVIDSADVILNGGQERGDTPAFVAETEALHARLLAQQLAARKANGVATDQGPLRPRSPAPKVRPTPTEIQPTNAVGQPTYNGLRDQAIRAPEPPEQRRDRERSPRPRPGPGRVPPRDQATTVPSSVIAQLERGERGRSQQPGDSQRRAGTEAPFKRRKGVEGTSVAPRSRPFPTVRTVVA